MTHRGTVLGGESGVVGWNTPPTPPKVCLKKGLLISPNDNGVLHKHINVWLWKSGQPDEKHLFVLQDNQMKGICLLYWTTRLKASVCSTGQPDERHPFVLPDNQMKGICFFYWKTRWKPSVCFTGHPDERHLFFLPNNQMKGICSV